MKGAIKKTIVFLICFAYGAYSYGRDLFNMALGRHKAILALHEGSALKLDRYKRAVVIAMYPNDDTVPFTMNVMKGFLNAGFFVLGVSTKPLSPFAAPKILPYCHCVIERFNIGYDMGSYQVGLKWIAQNPFLQEPDILAIANDSMFYPASIGDAIAQLLDSTADWVGLFESSEIQYHVQSFFELFRRPVIKSEAFRNFWHNYMAFSSRPYAISKGEIGLTAALLGAGFKPAVAYNLNTIREETIARLSANANDVVLAKALSLLSLSKDDILRNALEKKTRNKNPAHVLALLCNALFRAPLKRDLCRNAVAGADDILQIAQGFTAEELKAMERLHKNNLSRSIFSWINQRLKKAAGVA